MTGSRYRHALAEPRTDGNRRLSMIVPGDPGQPTGGYRYDARVAAELRKLGLDVAVIGLAGRFPDADEQARNALDTALRALPEGHIAIIDGLALGGLPEVARQHAERLALVALVHHPLADETGTAPALRRHLLNTETEALAACRRIVTTSEFTARRLTEMGVDRERVHVVPPGVDPAAPGTSGDSPVQRLICVGSLVPRKGQDLLIHALAELKNFSWRLELVGDPDRNPEFSRALRSTIDRFGLSERIAMCGVQDPESLGSTYRNADLLVVPSHYEGYGMVVTEALARALPMIATTGGALVDTVPPAAAIQVPPGDTHALADALRRWLEDAELRADKRAGAVGARRSLEDWAAAGRRFASALDLETGMPAE